MKDELVIQSLIELYKERGVDLHLLLDNPLFIHLPLHSRVNLIKQYASHIASPTSTVLNKGDVKSILIDSLAGAGLAGGSVLLRRLLANKTNGVSMPISMKGLALASGIGAAAGATKALFDRSSSISQRNDMNKAFNGLAHSGEDKDAIKLLALRNLQIGQPRKPGVTGKFMGSVVDNIVPLSMEYSNVVYAPKAVGVAGNRYINAIDKSVSDEFFNSSAETRDKITFEKNKAEAEFGASEKYNVDSTNNFLRKIQNTFNGLL